MNTTENKDKDETTTLMGTSKLMGSSQAPSPWAKRYRKMFVIPFILFLVSVLLISVVNYLIAPDRDDYDDYEEWQKASKHFNNGVNAVQNTANMFFTFGILCLSFLFFMGALIDRELPVSIKITMMILGVAIIAMFLADGIKLHALIG